MFSSCLPSLCTCGFSPVQYVAEPGLHAMLWLLGNYQADGISLPLTFVVQGKALHRTHMMNCTNAKRATDASLSNSRANVQREGL